MSAEPAAATDRSHGTFAGTYRELPLGAVRPAGWLAEQLQLQAEGLTGSLEELWADVGPRSAWLGGDGEAWERGPYYLDGLVPLAHLTGDERLLAKSSRWVEAIVAGQRPDGSFGPVTNDDWWPRMVALKALTQHAEATGDPRIAPFMERYFGYQLRELPGRPLRDWGRVRGADNVLSVLWLHARTAEPWLLDLCRLVLDQTADWDGYLRAFPCTGITRAWDHMTHVVNVAMGVKTPAARFALDGDQRHLETVRVALANLDRYHGQVHGMFSGDEWLAGPDATRGVELCAVVELMFSLEQMLLAWGDSDHADRLERLAFNLLPATMTADMTAHQYHQQANQVLATIGQRDWTQAGDDCTIFGLEPNFGCCTANLHQGWPKLVRSMWLETAGGGGLAAVVHGPSVVDWVAPDGTAVHLETETRYPFEETISMTLSMPRASSFEIGLRVPGWSDDADVRLGDAGVPSTFHEPFLVIDREWHDGDRLELRLPMTPRLIPRSNGAAGVALGPLVMALSPGEVWQRLPDSPGFGDYEVRPRHLWNMALAVDAASVGSARVERLGVQSPPFGLRTGSPPFGIDGVPLKVWVPGRRVPEWRLVDGSAAPPPASPSGSGDVDRPIPLVPYGSARLRIAEFPLVPPPAAGPAVSADEPPP